MNARFRRRAKRPGLVDERAVPARRLACAGLAVLTTTVISPLSDVGDS
jgi:hypothetical protein